MTCHICDRETFELSVARNEALKTRPDGRWRRSREKRLIRRLRSAWRKQRDFILDGLKDLKFLPKDEENAMADNVAPETEINDLVDQLPEQALVAETVVTASGVAMVRSGKRKIKEFGLAKFGISFDLENPTAKRILSKQLSHELSNGKGTIHSTTTDGIKSILTKAAENGDSIGEVSKKIRDQYDKGVFSVARGERIAQMELGRAYGEGQQIVMAEADDELRANGQAVEKKWNTMKDDKVRDDHRTNQNEGWIWVKQKHKGTQEMTAPSKRDFGCRCEETHRVVDLE